MNVELKGGLGGAWDTATHKFLYPDNFNQGLADYIVNKIRPGDVLEFGSGLGHLSKYINDKSEVSEYLCIEPNKIAGAYDSIEGPRLLPMDIFSDNHPYVINRKFDLVLSIEVAEHIELEKHEELFDFLVAHTSNWLIFSGARVGQGGLGHIAERDEEDWKSEFLKRGMVFESVITEAARAACSEKNINHKKNLMVFKRPSYLLALDDVERCALPYLHDLLAIIQSRSNYLDGNLFYVNLRDAINGMPNDSLKIKRDNYIGLVRDKSNILEIGFNAGHSLLLVLLVNNRANVTVVDTCQHPYTEACFNYFDMLFPDRIKLLKGNSVDVLRNISGEKFDLVHYDGGKEKTILHDLELTRELVLPNHVLVIDDTQNEKLNTIVRECERNGLIDLHGYSELTERLKDYKWKHAIATFTNESGDQGIMDKILRKLGGITVTSKLFNTNRQAISN